MIVWVDGTYGSGKTVVSSKICELVEDAILINADKFKNDVWCRYINENKKFDLALYGEGQFFRNPHFLEMFRNHILENVYEQYFF